jgi:hypothetical protein
MTRSGLEFHRWLRTFLKGRSEQCLDLISHKVATYESIIASTFPASPCTPADTAPNGEAGRKPRQ